MRMDCLDARKVQQVIEGIKAPLMTFIKTLVAVNSHSLQPENLARTAKIVEQALPAGFVRSRENDDFSNPWMFGQYLPDSAPVLLCGHLDTVFPPGEWDQGVTTKGSRLYGPGILDMKGGIGVMVASLWVLDRLGVLPEIPLVCFLNGDQEVGSLISRPFLVEWARRCRAGLVFERGGPDGAVVTSNRGLKTYRLRIQGQPGHAGLATREKKSAIAEMAHQILRIEKLSKPQRGLHLNVGWVQGGMASNVVPGLAEADLDIRYWDEALGGSAEERVMASLASPIVSGLSMELIPLHDRPVRLKSEVSARLFDQAVRAARHLGYDLEEAPRFSSSDASILAAAGLAVLDGLGPDGEGEHSLEEHIQVESLFQRVELTVHLLWRLKFYSTDSDDFEP